MSTLIPPGNLRSSSGRLGKVNCTLVRGKRIESVARGPLGGLRCFVRGQKVWRAFRHAGGSGRASLSERRTLAPRFPRYRALSQQVHEILQRHTDLIEPLSLGEAYLDVS